MGLEGENMEAAAQRVASAIENKGKGHVRHPVFVPEDKLPGPP